MFIRNKKDTIKLSKKTAESLELMRKQRFLEALKDNDELYLNNIIYKSLSIKEIFKLLRD